VVLPISPKQFDGLAFESKKRRRSFASDLTDRACKFQVYDGFTSLQPAEVSACF